MASIPCTVQVSIRTTTSRRSPRMAAQGQGEGEAAGGELRTPLLGSASGDVHTVSSPVPHSDAGKAKKKGNLHSVDEVVDVNVKRSNPSSSRLSKFGFPKLSEMFA